MEATSWILDRPMGRGTPVPPPSLPVQASRIPVDTSGEGLYKVGAPMCVGQWDPSVRNEQHPFSPGVVFFDVR